MLLREITLEAPKDVMLVKEIIRNTLDSLGFSVEQQLRLVSGISEICWFSLSARPVVVIFLDNYLRVQIVSKGLTWNELDFFAGEDIITNIKEGMYEIHVPLNKGSKILDKSDGTSFDIWDELRLQDQHILYLLKELQVREHDLVEMSRELDETNRGVIALSIELEEKAEHLERVSDFRGRFLSNMSHEFRTPINSVIALARILLDRVDGSLSAEQDKQVRFIQSSAEELLEMVNDLLDLAKVEAGKVTVNPTEINVNEFLATLRGMFRVLFGSKSVELVFEKSNIETIYTDEAKLSQILRNFISNSLKFTEKGEVSVTANLSETGKEIVFSVSDTGIGISKIDQERIFEEYAQVDTYLQKVHKGTGLGLYLSKKLVELLGGSVSVSSELGKGSMFSAIIPLRYGEESIDLQGSYGVSAGNDRLILLVDDEEVDRYILRDYLSEDYLVVEAKNGTDGLSLARDVRPAVIFLDLVMPGMDGKEVLKRLKGDETTADIPVIVVTSQELDSEVMRMATAFIYKCNREREVVLSMLEKILEKENS